MPTQQEVAALGPPPPRGSMHHTSISVSDMKVSVKFWDFFCTQILEWSTLHITDEHAMWYKYGAGAIGLSPGTSVPHHKFNPGVHHLAFNMEGRSEIDEAYQKLLKHFDQTKDAKLAKILDAPAEYQYMLGYYAVFFTDPDGIKLELVHTPPEAYLGDSAPPEAHISKE
ncbi:hypothetical protein BG004_006260 [Podila humilis]|nr:hypothetical protein BG004_006260 [Podila humilis]